MILKKINFRNFRNFLNYSFTFNPFLTIVIGENAKGKTNLLEGIYFLTNTIGFREKKEEELIFFNKDRAYVEGLYLLSDQKFTFRINLEKKNNIVEKKYFINKTIKNYSSYLKEQSKAILFSPYQIEIITGSPAHRRNYFDKFIGSFDIQYKKQLSNYENALKRRNKLLQSIKEQEKMREEISFWDNYLQKQGKYITEEREKYVNFLNNHPQVDNKKFFIHYIKNEFNKKNLEKFWREELRLKQTLIGPQRDDFRIYLNENDFKRNVHLYASRSEERLSLFWLKINEINFFEQMFNIKPIVLLDDIFSELDLYHKKLVLNLIKKYQTIVTTTEIEVLNLIEVPKSIIKL